LARLGKAGWYFDAGLFREVTTISEEFFDVWQGNPRGLGKPSPYKDE
jgi:hypothetical protein